MLTGASPYVQAVKELPRPRADPRIRGHTMDDAYAASLVKAAGAVRAADFPRHVRTSLDAAMEKATPNGELWRNLHKATRDNRVFDLGVGNDPRTRVLGTCALARDGEDPTASDAPCVTIKVFGPDRADVAAAEILNLKLIREKLERALDSPQGQMDAAWRADLKHAREHMTWYLQHDVNDVTGSVAVVIRQVPLHYLQAPTLHDALAAGTISLEDTWRVLADVLRVLHTLRTLFPGFKHNDCCLKNILVAQDLRGVLTSFGTATTPFESTDAKGLLSSPLIPRGLSLYRAMYGFTDEDSPCFDLHRLWSTLRLATLKPAALAYEAIDEKADERHDIMNEMQHALNSSRLRAEQVEDFTDALFPSEYFEEPAIYPGTQIITGPAQMHANNDKDVLTDIPSILKVPQFRKYVQSVKSVKSVKSV